MDAPTRDNIGHAFEHGFRLDRLRIEPVTGEVVGPGAREKLDPKVMGVLLLLAQHAGQVVSRDDLHEQLWPNAVVTDDALTRCIHELRRQLSRAGGDDRYRTLIETLPKRGYRLNGAVAAPALPEVAPPPQKARRAWIATAAVAAGASLILLALMRGEDPVPPRAAAVHSIAVLPFVDMSEAQDQGHFADGIADEILNRLAKSGGLRVIARTSSFSFRGEEVDIPTLAAKLDVSHVLEGSVRRSGDRVRIIAQLISAADNSHAWSETYDRDMGELLNVQEEIAEAVAAALRIRLAGASPGSSAPVKPDAYELFLQGRFFFNRRAPGDIERAAQYFRDSLARDPSYPRAWAALAGAYNLLLVDNEGAEETLRPLQGEAAMRAVELGPVLAVAHARLAQYYFEIGDREKGEEHFSRARALDHDDPLVLGFSSDIAVRSGDFDGGVDIWRRLVEQDPLSATDRQNYAHFLLWAGKAEEAAVQFRKALELNPQLHWDSRLGLVRTLVLQRRHLEAASECGLLPAGLPQDHGLAFLHEAPGRGPQADAALERLLRAGDEADRIVVAEAYALRGMTDDAFATLAAARRAAQDPSIAARTVRARIHEFRMDVLRSPFLSPLRSDPRWQPVIAEPR
ncbi:MAG TPA: winged helix-turn-helix domain-containing protein [Steroidobacteraceae bacterium]|nr:winged helix-turn-helix domain-containing protein [Steroidobacteraceae bacterium]